MKTINNRKKYVHALEEYFQLSESNKKGPNLKADQLAVLIREYKNDTSLRFKIIRVVTSILIQTISSIVIGLAIIWSLNEVLSLAVPFTIKNVLIVSFLILIGKVKLFSLERL